MRIFYTGITETPQGNLGIYPVQSLGKTGNRHTRLRKENSPKEDKVQINKINEVQTLFPDKVLVPKIEPGDSCGCGFVWLEPTLGDCESTNNFIASKTSFQAKYEKRINI